MPGPDPQGRSYYSFAFSLELLDLNEVTREVIALTLSDLQRNRVALQSELANDLPTITGHRIQLQQVILNLRRNASDAIVGVDDRPRQLLIRAERDDSDRVRVSVRDAGVGVDFLSRYAPGGVFGVWQRAEGRTAAPGYATGRALSNPHHRDERPNDAARNRRTARRTAS